MKLGSLGRHLPDMPPRIEVHKDYALFAPSHLAHVSRHIHSADKMVLAEFRPAQAAEEALGLLVQARQG